MRVAVGAGLLGLLSLTACATVPASKAPYPSPRPVAAKPAAPPARPAPPSPPPPQRPSLVALSTLPGWADEDHVAALTAFRATCGVAKSADWRAVCRRAREQTLLDPASARAFFEDNFRAEARRDTGLLTAYFAPEYPARDEPDEIFSAPVLPKPDDLVLGPPADGETGGRRAVLQQKGDATSPYPERAEIEAAPVAQALAFMRPEDLFFMQIQGSGSLVFPDGRRVKAIYAADNGRPFTPIARPMAQAGLLAPNRVSGDGIRDWLASHRGAEAAAVMDKNPRYVFFDLVPEDQRDPAGAAGVALPAGRSLAVDPTYHPLGQLFWIDAAAPTLAGARTAYRRLALALDTGSAIRGEVRADLYLGRGEAAGLEAGRVRHTLTLVPLVPAPEAGWADRSKNETEPRG